MELIFTVFSVSETCCIQNVTSFFHSDVAEPPIRQHCIQLLWRLQISSRRVTCDVYKKTELTPASLCPASCLLGLLETVSLIKVKLWQNVVFF